MVYIVGANGQLGRALSRLFKEAKLLDRSHFDLAQPHAITSFFGRIRLNPEDVLINAAAITDVDRAEKEKELTKAVNTTAASQLAGLFNQMIQISTEFVFDGTGTSPWTEISTPNPINWYGETKLLAEHAVLAASPNHRIVRVSWLYGESSNCFPAKILAASKKNNTLKVVDDQIGAPTSCLDVANFLASSVSRNKLIDMPRIIHLKFENYKSRKDWAEEIIRVEAQNVKGFRAPKIEAVSTEEYSKNGNLARRPLNCRLETIHGEFIQQLKLKFSNAIQ